MTVISETDRQKAALHLLKTSCPEQKNGQAQITIEEAVTKQREVIICGGDPAKRTVSLALVVAKGNYFDLLGRVADARVAFGDFCPEEAIAWWGVSDDISRFLYPIIVNSPVYGLTPQRTLYEIDLKYAARVTTALRRKELLGGISVHSLLSPDQIKASSFAGVTFTLLF